MERVVVGKQYIVIALVEQEKNVGASTKLLKLNSMWIEMHLLKGKNAHKTPTILALVCVFIWWSSVIEKPADLAKFCVRYERSAHLNRLIRTRIKTFAEKEKKQQIR